GRVYMGDVVGARVYMAGRAAHVAGIAARGSTLTIRLVAPAPDLPTRLALPFFCAVPVGTPLDPDHARPIPMAGPYRIAAYTPGQGVELVPNPNYHGSRPHRLQRIEFVPGVAPRQQMEDVASGKADYAFNVPRSDMGRSGLSVHVFPQLDMLDLNTHRPLF